MQKHRLVTLIAILITTIILALYMYSNITKEIVNISATNAGWITVKNNSDIEEIKRVFDKLEFQFSDLDIDIDQEDYKLNLVKFKNKHDRESIFFYFLYKTDSIFEYIVFDSDTGASAILKDEDAILISEILDKYLELE